MPNWKVKSPLSLSAGKIVVDCKTVDDIKKQGMHWVYN